MNYRDYLQRLIYRVIDLPVRGLVRVGVTPNMVTTGGLVLNLLATAMLLYGGYGDTACPYVWLAWGGGMILFAGLFDMLDGRVARVGGKSSVFGALYDSVLDRYSELFTLFGFCGWFAGQDMPLGLVVAFLAMVGSLMVSYVRARAEGLGVECKVGLMQRPERVVLAALGSVLGGVLVEPLVLLIALALIAVLANFTAVWRIVHCRKVLHEARW
jgi:CDP-diacylglycerol--glycerol-3-phosphate 3-phosphatidyltransferase